MYLTTALLAWLPKANYQKNRTDFFTLHAFVSYFSFLDPFGQRSHHISIKFPLHKQSENTTNQDVFLARNFTVVHWRLKCLG